MFAYCENNPVNRADPTGHSWKSFWNKVGNAIETVVSAVVKAVKTVAKKTVNTANKIKAKVEKPVSRIWKSMEIDVGVGAGFRGDIGSGIAIDAGYSTNAVQLHINDGEVSVIQSLTAGVTMDAIYYTVGYRSTEMHDLNWNNVKAPEDTLGFSTGTTTIFSIAFYVGIGGSVEVAFNWDEFIDYYE